MAEHLAAGLGDVTSLLWSADEEALWMSDARADLLHRYAPANDALGTVRTHAGSSGESPLERPGLGAMTERSLATTVIADRAALGDAIPDELAVAPDGTVWVVLERARARGLARVSSEGAVATVESPTDLGDLAITPEGVVLATRTGRPELVSWSADGVPLTARGLGAGEPPFVMDMGRDLVLDHEGRIFVATSRGIAIHAADGARLGAIETGALVQALAWGEPGALYAIVADELVRVRWPEPTSR